ncbi:MAG: sigma-70 family RNA polymerase sigma factor [Chitinophagales bacterium]
MKEREKYSEEELIRELKTRSRKAFDYLYDNYSPALYGVIINIIRNEQTAHDLLQEAFIKIWNGIETYDSAKSRLYTWMLNIARNLSIDKIRAGNSLSRKENKDYIRKENENTQHTPFVEGIGLRGLVNELEMEQKQIIELLYFKGYTQSEAAEELNIPLGTVKSRVRLAMVKLRKHF